MKQEKVLVGKWWLPDARDTLDVYLGHEGPADHNITCEWPVWPPSDLDTEIYRWDLRPKINAKVRKILGVEGATLIVEV